MVGCYGFYVIVQCLFVGVDVFCVVVFGTNLVKSVHAYLIDFLLVDYCLVQGLLRLLGLYSEAVLHMLSGFLVLVSPINTRVNAKHMHRD